MNKDLTKDAEERKIISVGGEGWDACDKIDRITSRHIAKLLTRLGTLIPPVAEQEIKRQFRFFSEDIKEYITGDSHDEEDSKYNR